MGNLRVYFTAETQRRGERKKTKKRLESAETAESAEKTTWD
jgi:hypothetical protein